jgi:hypothetical protein
MENLRGFEIEEIVDERGKLFRKFIKCEFESYTNLVYQATLFLIKKKDTKNNPHAIILAINLKSAIIQLALLTICKSNSNYYF